MLLIWIDDVGRICSMGGWVHLPRLCLWSLCLWLWCWPSRGSRLGRLGRHVFAYAMYICPEMPTWSDMQQEVGYSSIFKILRIYFHWNSDYQSDMWHDIHMVWGYTGCNCYIRSTQCSWLQFCIIFSHLYIYNIYVISCPPNWRLQATLSLADGSTQFNKHWHHQPINPLPRHLWLYGVGARRHLRWWLHDWLARQALDLAEPCRLATVTVGRGQAWTSWKYFIGIHEPAQVSHMFALIFIFTVLLLLLSGLFFFCTGDICWW